jgi:hypothetical protein
LLSQQRQQPPSRGSRAPRQAHRSQPSQNNTHTQPTS